MWFAAAVREPTLLLISERGYSAALMAQDKRGGIIDHEHSITRKKLSQANEASHPEVETNFDLSPFCRHKNAPFE